MVKGFLFAHWASNYLVTSFVGHCFGYGFRQAKSFVSIATEAIWAFGALAWCCPAGQLACKGSAFCSLERGLTRR
jgi:hypothetical protein